jgi:homoserine dehydrogenase
VTDSAHRSRGIGRFLLRHLEAQGAQLAVRCARARLGHPAHRRPSLLFREGLVIPSFSFRKTSDETHQCRSARHRHRRWRHLQRTARNEAEITRRAGRPIRITKVADKNLELARQVTAGRAQVTDDAFAVVTDPEIDIVIELIGGYGIAKELVLKAIANGKHVVTANKALLACMATRSSPRRMKRASWSAFEAAVAGGIPIIKALREGLTANRIQWIAGIINGTTNFILSEMRDKGLPFDVVLKEAQRLGYAEADPTFDIEGVDAAHKITILSALAFGIPMQFDKAHVEGISKLTPTTSSTPSSSATASSCWASPAAARRAWNCACIRR